ncbi:MAG: 4-hydroxybenzoate octaprenyltransferase [Gammaproteobacteria bacterium]
MPSSFRKKLISYTQLMRLHRPIPLWLMLWPILWALWIAGEGHPPVNIVLIFIFGVIVMRSAGCVINDIWDRDIDKHVPRTKMRPLAAGIVTVKEAVVLALILLAVAFLLVLNLNFYTMLLAIAAVLGVWIYPFMKRVTYYPQVVLGLVFNWGVLLVFSAMQNTVPPIAIALLATSLLWTVAYDTLYAIPDRPADLKIHMKSTAILLGDMDRFGVAVLQILFVLGLIFIGRELQMNIYYYLGLIVVFSLFVYQWWMIRKRDPDACFDAFLHNNWVGVMVFLSIIAGMSH